ncbi:MAG: molybdopterin-dependent oxidoreductase, partial [Myxococcales bacterium]|nr:molybdopterin-dependent oxidoreductase [Myxococcales bacterium]
LWAGQGLQRQPTGGNVMRAIGLLPAFTGNVGKPGAGFYYLNIWPALVGADLDALAGAELAAGEVPKINHIGLAGELERHDRFRAFITWNTNPVASAAEQARLRRALSREDLFTVVVDCFPTDTADYADIVLPAASFLEFDDLTFSYMNPMIGAQTRARAPIGEALPNTEIFRRLARAMGFEDKALFETDDELIARLLAEMSVPISFGELSRVGHCFLSKEPLNFHEGLAFDTPSGKIEIASDAAVAQGLSRLPTPEADPRPASGVFRLLSPASKWRLNDSYANDPTIAKRSGTASVTVHPDDAEAAGIVEGANVRLSNDAGSIELCAVIAALAPRGVLLSHKGRWPKCEDAGANVNVLHMARSSDVAGCSAVHGTEVRLEVLP